jgi:hypothetical protein
MSATGEPEIKKIRVEQIVLEQVVSLINLGMRRTGLAPGTEDERDIGQVRVAIESVRALLPVLGQAAPAQIGQIRDALSQLQMAFVRLGGAPAEADDAAPARPGAGPSGPAPGAGARQPDPPGPAGPAAPGTGGPGGPQGEPAKPEEGGPAQRSGRLWIPGQ